MKNKKSLSQADAEKLITLLKTRFEKNSARHKGLDWEKVQSKLKANPEKLWSLNEMERTGGEPDLVVFDNKEEKFVFVDCSPENPKGRRSLCFDRAALNERKEHKPKDDAMTMASAMGIEILSEDEYRQLQELGTFDTTTSSWVQTPEKIRKLGGALFCDRRYNHVFLYHNGAQSYYASRGFRGMLLV